MREDYPSRYGGGEQESLSLAEIEERLKAHFQPLP